MWQLKSKVAMGKVVLIQVLKSQETLLLNEEVYNLSISKENTSRHVQCI